MTVGELKAHYPVLYHVSSAGSWPSIQTHGLLSTAAILDLFEVDPTQRAAIERQCRRTSVELTHSTHGRIVIRDQRVLSESKLAGCLSDGLSTEDWLIALNRKVFFWLKEHRFAGLLNARAYRGDRQTVITVDTARLLERHENEIELSHMNSGSTSPFAHTRGRDTFKSIADYPFEARKRMRGLSNAIAELTVDYAVPNVAAFAIRVDQVGAGQPPEVLWERG